MPDSNLLRFSNDQLLAMPFVPSSILVTSSKALVTRSDALVPSSFLPPPPSQSHSLQLVESYLRG